MNHYYNQQPNNQLQIKEQQNQAQAQKANH